MKKTLQINYRRLADGEHAPWQVMTTLDEATMSEVRELKFVIDDGSHGLPFRFADNDMVTLVVSDNAHNGKLQKGRAILQTITRIERSTGNILRYRRTGINIGGVISWSAWEKAGNANEFDVQWNGSSHINSLTKQATYYITGERTNRADGLPISNAAPGHTISCRLFVLDSSINSDEVCVTQVLMLSNRLGGDGNTYIRTGNARSRAELEAPDSTLWGPWGKMQANIEVGTTGLGSDKDLADFIDNGMYSGVDVDTDTTGNICYETFVMVVINNYAVAGYAGKTRSISQFKYALTTDGTFSYKTRTGRGNDKITWDKWINIDKDSMLAVETEKSRAMRVESDLQEDIDAIVAQTVPKGTLDMDRFNDAVKDKINNPLRPLFIAAGAEYNDTGADITKTAPWGETVTHKAGHYYLNELGDITEEQMKVIYNEKNLFENCWKNRGCQFSKARTLIPAVLDGQTYLKDYYSFGGLVWSFSYNLEILKFGFNQDLNDINSASRIPMLSNSNQNALFYSCRNLRIVYPINAVNVTVFLESNFEGCYMLKEVRLFNLKTNISFKDCSNISKNSLLYMIDNAVPTSAMTMILHADAYARLSNDTDVVTALERQPLVSLVSA